MQRRLTFSYRVWLLAAAAMAVVALLATPSAVHACAKVSFVSLYGESTLARGQVAGWRDAGPAGGSGLREVVLTVRVDSLYRGESERLVTLVDRQSYALASDGSGAWRGDTAACAGLDADPTGKTVLLAFEPGDGDVRTLASPGILYIGHGTDAAGNEDPTFAEIDTFLRAEVGEPEPLESGRTWIPLVVTIGLVSVLLMAVGVLRRRFVQPRRPRDEMPDLMPQ